MFTFREHVIDTALPARLYAQTALADMDSDGRLVYITGQQYGTILGHRINGPDDWTRFVLGQYSPSMQRVRSRQCIPRNWITSGAR